MKRAYLLCLLLALLLNSACVMPEYPTTANTTPAGTPKATSRPTPLPTREPIEDTTEFAKWYCKEYGLEYQEDLDAAFLYVKNTQPSDFYIIRPEFPEELYSHPYNLWANPQEEERWFKTNVGCTTAYGLDWVVAAMEAAKGFSRVSTNRDYTRNDDNVLYSDIYYYTPSEREDQNAFAKDYIKEDRKNELIQIGTFVTDRGLVYQAEDAFLRVRGRVFINIRHATEAYLKENECKLNTWYWFDMEYMVLPQNSSEDSEYPHSMFVVYNWIYITSGWQEADASMIALAEANMA